MRVEEKQILIVLYIYEFILKFKHTFTIYEFRAYNLLTLLIIFYSKIIVAQHIFLYPNNI